MAIGFLVVFVIEFVCISTNKFDIEKKLVKTSNFTGNIFPLTVGQCGDPFAISRVVSVTLWVRYLGDLGPLDLRLSTPGLYHLK